jgi:beta-glucosidase
MVRAAGREARLPLRGLRAHRTRHLHRPARASPSFSTLTRRPSCAQGHGLSYSTFEYDNLSIRRDPHSTGAQVRFDVRNTGAVAAAEVAQLYLVYPTAAAEPFPQLRGFEKVRLQPGQSTNVVINLTDRWLSTWDVGASHWALARGTFEVRIGSSVADIRLNGTLGV